MLPPPTNDATSSPAFARTQVEASVRIEHPAAANKKEWERSPSSSRREILIRDEDGKRVLVRVIQYE
jgi:hypothetical protein